VGIEPEYAEAIADFRVGEVVEKDAVGAWIWEWEVGFAGEGEVGVELYGVAYVDGNEECWPGFGCGESAGVLLGLAAGFEHGFVPERSAADGGSAALAGGAGKDRSRSLRCATG
jgi:hypothetical protein